MTQEVLLPPSGSHLQVLTPVTLILTSFFMPLISRWAKRWREPAALIASGIVFLFSIIILSKVIHSPEGHIDYFPGFSWSGQRFLSTGQPIGILIRTDLFGCIMLILSTALGFLVVLYSTKYIPHEVAPGKIGYYYTLVLLMIASLCGISLTGDIFNFYVFLEVASITSYALVAIPGRATNLEASFKYMLSGAIGSIFIVFGIGLIFSATGTLNMHYASLQVSRILSADTGSYLYNYRHLVFASLGFFILGFFVKAAYMPAHAWLADAHPVAPSSISALLSGLIVKATGIFILIRFLYSVFGAYNGYFNRILIPLFLVVATITIIMGSVFAIAQTNLKRMLAFSTIAQLGYILLGVGLMTQDGLVGSILHIINHALIKVMLFLCSGVVIYKTGIRKIADMGGIGFKMPVTMGCFTVGALAMVGVPPLNGFMSKWALATAANDAGHPLMVGVLMLSSLLNAVYYFRVVVIAYFGGGHGGHSSSGDTHHSGDEGGRWEAPIEMLAPLVILAVFIFLSGVRADLPLRIIRPAVKVLFKG